GVKSRRTWRRSWPGRRGGFPRHSVPPAGPAAVAGSLPAEARTVTALLLPPGRLLELVDLSPDRQPSPDLVPLAGRVPGVFDLRDGGLKGVADAGVRVVQPLSQCRDGGPRLDPDVGQASGRHAADPFVLVLLEHPGQGGHDLVAVRGQAGQI